LIAKRNFQGRPHLPTECYQADLECFGLEVYDGRIRLGRIYNDGGRCIAEDADGRELGTFTDSDVAVSAVLRAVTGQRDQLSGGEAP